MAERLRCEGCDNPLVWARSGKYAVHECEWCGTVLCGECYSEHSTVCDPRVD